MDVELELEVERRGAEADHAAADHFALSCFSTISFSIAGSRRHTSGGVWQIRPRASITRRCVR